MVDAVYHLECFRTSRNTISLLLPFASNDCLPAKGIILFHPGKLQMLFVCTSRSLSKAAPVMKENVNDTNFSIPLSAWYDWPALAYQGCLPFLLMKGNSLSDSKPYLSRARRPR